MLDTRRLAVLLALVSPALAQAPFVNDAASIPFGSPGNLSDTEQIDFGDVDLDGDFDAVLATGGDSGNQQNRIWINRGHAQNGTLGTFADQTATRFPALLDDSRDIEFADVDGDGDLDLHTANTSDVTSQACRWWINMGGAQGGSAGYYQDQTAARWIGLGGAGSSVWPNQVLGSGGFVDWCSDADFADLDNDGDPDLFHSSTGSAHSGSSPIRVFLNDGSGAWTEFNPSGFQLAGTSIVEGNPGLWCSGAQQSNTSDTTGANCDVASAVVDGDLGDFDADFDLDVVVCGDASLRPRVYRNRLAENGGALGFRDFTGGTFTTGYPYQGYTYEQELGDVDDDGDLDLYGLNWGVSTPYFDDTILLGDGAGTFAYSSTLPNSSSDEEEGDFLDYDADGDLDLFVANFSGQDRLYRNELIGVGSLSWTDQTSSVPAETAIGRDIDACDVDADGDTDVFVANGAVSTASVFLRNVTQVPDVRAPRIALLEQSPNRSASTAPTVVRAHILDNAPDYVVAFMAHGLEYRVNGGSFQSAAMTWSGGQVYRGEIPGLVLGAIDYRVRSTDLQGNVALSAIKSFSSSGTAVAYCTSGTTTNGCSPAASWSGTPSATASSGFTITASAVEGQRAGILFYGVSGRTAVQWAPGSTSLVCVKSPVQRTLAQQSGGTSGACDGVLAIDWNAFMSSHPAALGQPLAPGQVVNSQAWFRDPSAPATTNLSDAVEFVVGP